MFKSYICRPAIRHHASGGTFYPDEVAKLYNFPRVTITKTVPIACIELGGGYRPADMAAFFHARGLPAANIRDISVLGATNSPGSDADVEVALDIQIAAAVFSYMTGQPASILVPFAPNTIDGFAGCYPVAAQAGAVPSTSWGGAERSYGSSDIAKMESGLKTCDDAGLPIPVAAGDNGSSDGQPGNNVDYPGSSVYAIPCGGTNLIVNSDGSLTEQVWNNSSTQGATGGGFSALFGVPPWQAGFVPSGVRGRGVPDVAGLADPETGFLIYENGQWQTVGGTSCTAPLYAGYFAALMSAGLSLKDIHHLLYANESAFVDITVGSN